MEKKTSSIIKPFGGTNVFSQMLILYVGPWQKSEKEFKVW